MSLVTGLFFLVFLLNQRWSPLLRFQASHCSTFHIMCDVPSIAVFRSESIEHFPGIDSKFFLKLPVTIPVAPIITGTIVHFRFLIRCISIHKLLYFNFFFVSFCTTLLSAGIATSISVHVFSFLFLIIIYGLFAVTYYYYYSSRISRKERIRNVTIIQQIGLDEPIIKETEQNQRTWYGHFQTMAEWRLPKIALKWMPKQKRARGRPKKNWM